MNAVFSMYSISTLQHRTRTAQHLPSDRIFAILAGWQWQELVYGAYGNEVSVVRIGTCSWKFPSWNGLVYDPDSPSRYLAQYARRFSTVEIDQWFWSLFGERSLSLPSRETVAEYLADTPDNFTFSIKVPNSITLTHFYRKSRSEPLTENPHFLSADLFERFLELIEPLGERTVALMFQFEYLNKRKMPNPVAFIEALDRFFSSLAARGYRWPLAVEPRNPQFLTSAYFNMLAHHSVSHVFTHGYYMPEAWKVGSAFGHLMRDRAVIRLLGRDRKGMESKTGKEWNMRVAPQDEELEQIADMIADLEERGFTTTVNVNNHYEGSAPGTIEALTPLLSSRSVTIS